MRPVEPGAVIVAIDEPSFAEIGRQWPWPRDLHARLVDSLRRAGAAVIGLDIIFAEPSTPEADAALAKALGKDVVLASDLTRIESPQADQTVRVEPVAALMGTGAGSGLVSVGLDGDGALRRVPSFGDSFAEAVLARAGRPAEPAPPNALLQFFGPPRSYETVSYYQALAPETYLPKDALRGKIVLVGLSLQNAPSLDQRGADAFATPFSLESGRLTAGVEVQATILDNLAHRLFVRPVTPAGLVGLTLLVALAAALMTLKPVTWRTAVLGLAGALAVAALSFVALQTLRVWASPALPILAGGLVLGVKGSRDFIAERRQRRAITRAFAHYLAPDLVERLARDPSLLRLGGERRRLSILFCDVRGFTALSETMKDDPERLTGLINRLLDPLSEAVLSHGGTIDKYIGDCVMAFWNAPLDDPLHERHAVACALAMVAALDRFNATLAAEATPGETPLTFAVGIGVNSGDCVVGNVGSSRRFDYSALGDAVNLASRLEGLSKLYGVALVVGAETAKALGDEPRLVELDLISVKGRGGALPIYTLVAGEPLSRAFLTEHAAMLTAYRAGRFEAALTRLAAARPHEPRLAAYHDRMGQLMTHYLADPPGPDWLGVFRATTK